jgi:uncharacterized protein
MTRRDLERTVAEFMDSHTTMTLACCSGSSPWAAAVYYARHGLDLVFFSSPASRHSTVLAENPRAAAAIHGDYEGWQEIKGLQMEGSVEQIKGATAKAVAMTTYLVRYPFAKDLLFRPGMVSARVARKMAKVVLYKFRPDSIVYMDNEAEFGTRWKLEIKDGRAVADPVRA